MKAYIVNYTGRTHGDSRNGGHPMDKTEVIHEVIDLYRFAGAEDLEIREIEYPKPLCNNDMVDLIAQAAVAVKAASDARERAKDEEKYEELRKKLGKDK